MFTGGLYRAGGAPSGWAAICRTMLAACLGLAAGGPAGLAQVLPGVNRAATQPDADALARRSAAEFKAAHTRAGLAREPEAGLKVWEEFLARWPASAQAPAAAEQRTVWRERVADRARWVDRRWWTQRQITAGLAASAADLAAARAALAALRGSDAPPPTTRPASDTARAAARAALAQFPIHRDAVYVRGLISLHQGQYTQAADDFLRATELDPAFWPAWTNRAVALAQVRSFPAAVLAAQQALRVCPPDHPDVDQLLDNLDEALRLVPRESESGTAMQQARKVLAGRLNERIARQQSTTGLMRWGVSWVPREQYQKILDETERINAAIAGPAARRAAALASLATIKEDLQANARQMEVIERILENGGGTTAAPLTPAMLDKRRRLREQREQMLVDAREAQESLALANQEIAELERQRPVPPYRGQLAAFDDTVLDRVPPSFLAVEGAQARPAAPAVLEALRSTTSQPASAPVPASGLAVPGWALDSPLPPR